MTHAELCEIAAHHLVRHGIAPFVRCRYAVSDLYRIGEQPDAYGWSGGGTTQLIEVKTSRADFMADRNKPWRKHPALGLGMFRSYLCPERVIQPEELPEGWGLLYISERRIITKIKTPKIQRSAQAEEIAVITSIMRRQGIKPQVFKYTKYKKTSDQ